MKAFTVLVILLFMIFLIASTGIAQVDLTPDTPPAVVNQPVVPLAGGDDDVVVIQDNTQPQFPLPVTGPCTNPYIVQPGDILSAIAESCGTSVAAIRQANPEITNANMIYPGQQLTIVDDGGAAAAGTGQQAQIVPEQPQVQPTQPLPGVPQSQAPEASVDVPVPISGPQPRVQPGTPLEVIALDYPANTPVSIAVGPQVRGYTVIATGLTDANGSLRTTVVAPNASDPQEPWVVVVATTGSNPVQAMSNPFYIGGLQ